MWQYNCSDELMHYGVLGMKWGQRRYRHLSKKVSKLRDKRSDIYIKKGAPSNAYRSTSKKLYLERSKMNLQKAKNEHNLTEKVRQKDNIRTAKYIKKYGSSAHGSLKRTIYGNKPTNQDLDAITIKEYGISSRRYKMDQTKRTAKRLAIYASPIVVAAGTTYINKNMGKWSRNLSPKGLKNLDKGIGYYNKSVGYVNQFLGRR